MHQHGSSNQPRSRSPKTGLSLPIRLVLYVSIGIVAYFLITEHLVHLSSLLPYSFLIVFVLLHLFMHGGHGGGNDDDRVEGDRSDSANNANQSNSRRKNHARHE